MEGKLIGKGRVKCEEVGVWIELPSVSVSIVSVSPSVYCVSSLPALACLMASSSSSSSSEVGGSLDVVAENASVSIDGPRVCFGFDFRLPNMIAEPEPAEEELEPEFELGLGDVDGR